MFITTARALSLQRAKIESHNRREMMPFFIVGHRVPQSSRTIDHRCNEKMRRNWYTSVSTRSVGGGGVTMIASVCTRINPAESYEKKPVKMKFFQASTRREKKGTRKTHLKLFVKQNVCRNRLSKFDRTPVLLYLII